RAVLWPACFARLGVVLDARGTQELVRFNMSRRRGAYVALAGGAVAMRVGERNAESFELRRRAFAITPEWDWSGGAGLVPSRLGQWRFRRLASADERGGANDHAVFGLPVGALVTIRSWRAGDRIRTAGAPAGRRVTRYFSDAHVPALDRSGWPVVLVGDALLCVPGLCRSVAAPHRPGTPDSIWYRCEREPD
ncbi:MAG: tRNA lysidine(34) synthetase TilS, partial [Gemmatimonas sp.]